jgi:hypothetical protein
MPVRPIGLTILFSRVLQLIAGVTAALLGVFLFVRIFTEALSIGHGIKPLTDLKVFMILALPGIIIALGSYFQVIWRNQWAVIVVLIAAIANVVLVVFNVGLAYALMQDPWGRTAMVADFVATGITMFIAICNTLLATLNEVVEKPRRHA